MNEKFTGLSNQGATCYMNSLLQTLFMTPEFLSRIYQWQWDPSKHNSKKDCIPYQLQLLFAKLHLKKLSVVETTGLTTSFQWDMRESLQQHDVQEFCRVLFDAIEMSVKGTEQERMITEIYQGHYVDYVKCLHCAKESTREDKFLDLSLAVRSLGWEYNDSLEKALNGFIKPDKLCGDNKYFCENCNEKTDARKGLKFSKLPLILALQLKRFDLDCTTLQRKKINDRVTFPLKLNMNKFIASAESESSLESSDDPSYPENSEIDEKDLDNLIDQIQPIGSSTIEHDETNGEINSNTYELFSIMIHSGSALGGHYYAYIKSFESNKWFNFNDSQVKEIEISEIEKAYGGIIGNGIFGSNAYLLMYRNIRETNLKSVPQSQIPSYLLEEIHSEEEIKLKEQKEKEEKLMMIEVRVLFKYTAYILKVNKHISLNIFKKKCIKDLHFNIEEEDIRFRKYSYQYDQCLETFSGKESQSLDQLGITATTSLWIETKTADEDFLEYDPNMLNIKICVWREPNFNVNLLFRDLTSNPYRLQVPFTFKLKDLLNFLAKHFHYSFDNIRLWKKMPFISKTDILEVTDPKHLNSALASLKISDGFLLLMEEKNVKSNWKAKIDKESNHLFLRFNDPRIDLPLYVYQLFEEKTCAFEFIRLKIAMTLHLDRSDFKIRKSSKNGREIIATNQTLSDLDINNHTILHIELAPPSAPDIFSISFTFATVSTKNEDHIWYTFHNLFHLNLNKYITHSELKQLVCQETNIRYPSMQLEPSKIRLREKLESRLSHVINNKDCLEYFLDRRIIEIAIEDCDEAQDAEIVCVFRRWHASTWDLTPPMQLLLNKYANLPEIGFILGELYGIPSHLIEITRITYLNNFIRGDLLGMDWVRLNSGFLEDKPFYIKNHGCCFIIKDSSETIKKLSRSEKASYTYKYWKYPHCGGYTARSNNREKSVKITVKK